MPEWTQQIPGLRGAWSTRWLDAKWDGNERSYSLLVRSEYEAWVEGQQRIHEIDELVRLEKLTVEALRGPTTASRPSPR